MARGGYRQPSEPAPVSGPGALSRRTDGGPADSQPIRELPDAAYGEQKAFREQQAAAPMAASGAPRIDPSSLVPLDAPSQETLEPITAGAKVPGAPQEPGEFDIMRFRSWLPALKVAASRPDASPATKQFVRQLEAYM